MHEMAITQSLLDTVCECAERRRVHRIDVEVGVLCAVVGEAMQFCFSLASENTVAEGAYLSISTPPGEARCRSCGLDFAITEPMLPVCRCGSTDVEIVSGRQLRIRSMEVSQSCAPPVDAEATMRR